MKTIHVLTKGFDTPNSCAFLFPLIMYRQALREYGIELKFFNRLEQMTDADVIITSNKYFSKQWSQNTPQIIENFLRFRQQTDQILFFDISDSSGWQHARILPYVDKYVKNQVLTDRVCYLKPLYGHRLFTDYYHLKDGVVDQQPSYSEVVTDPASLEKLRVGWNSGLADYSLYGPYRMMIYSRLPWRGLLSFPKKFFPPSVNRQQDLSCRMGIQYARNTVAWQRKKIQQKLQKYLPTEKLSRRKYYGELINSKIVISPFGWGEITLKDFEVFITGGLLLKPDMSHMETWPNWYLPNQTFCTYHWDLSNLETVIEATLANYADMMAIAEAGQENYRQYLIGPQAAQLFCEHFVNIVNV